MSRIENNRRRVNRDEGVSSIRVDSSPQRSATTQRHATRVGGSGTAQGRGSGTARSRNAARDRQTVRGRGVPLAGNPLQTGGFFHTQRGANSGCLISSLPRLVIALVLVVAVLAGVGFSVASCIASAASEGEGQVNEEAAVDGSAEATIEDWLAACPGYTLNPQDFSNLPDTTIPVGFSLVDAASAPKMSGESMFAITSALSPYFYTEVPVGFVLMDAATGRGFAYNVDAVMYAASAVKAPYITYVCQSHIETGAVALGDACVNVVEGSSGYFIDDTSTIERQIREAIVYSNNGPFVSLRETFDGEAFTAWTTSLGLDSSLDGGDAWFVSYSTRDAVRLWMNTLSYLNTGTETATWYSELLSQTETSYIREALATDVASDLLVRNKAGWCIDETDAATYNGMCDCGIVTKGGRDYVLCVMTSASYSEPNKTCIENLIAAVFAAREDLA